MISILCHFRLTSQTNLYSVELIKSGLFLFKPGAREDVLKEKLIKLRVEKCRKRTKEIDSKELELNLKELYNKAYPKSTFNN